VAHTGYEVDSQFAKMGRSGGLIQVAHIGYEVDGQFGNMGTSCLDQIFILFCSRRA
jgi:hypothetical protein